MDDRSPAEHDESLTRPAGTIRCRSCAYDLRGLDPTSSCPECGTPVTRTLAGDALTHADPDWVRRLALGLWVGLAATALVVVLNVPAIAERAYGANDGSPGAMVRAWLVYGFQLVLGVVGIWYLTTPEPGVNAEWTGGTLRRALRVGVLIGTAFHLADFGELLPTQGVGGGALTLLAYDVGGPALTVMWWVFLRRLLLRVPLEGLALAARFMTVGTIVIVLATQWFPWILWALARSEESAARFESTVALVGNAAFTVLGAIVVALSARALGRLADAHPAGGASSQSTDSPDRG